MKAVILAGGKGFRLLPLTKKTNKHLLPINGKPMILYVIDNAVASGLKNIIIVYNKLGKKIPAVVTKYINFNYPEVNLQFIYEKGEIKGVAHSVFVAKNAIGKSDFVVIFGDVIFENNHKEYIRKFSEGKMDAKLLLARTPTPESHASVNFKNGRLKKIIEKCKNPKNNVIVTTYDIFNSDVWKYMKYLKPSQRGELEITDLRNFLIQNHRVGYAYVSGWWIDAGTPDRLKKAGELLRKNNTGN